MNLARADRNPPKGPQAPSELVIGSDPTFREELVMRSGARPPEQALAPDCEPPLGAHMVTPRLGYTHHGIYAGQGRIVQYGGLARGLRCGPVEEVSLAEFCQGHPIRIRLEESCQRDPTAVLHRARLRLGENRYHLLRNNCEHFCEWCVHGEHRSYQVEELIGRCARIWRHVIETAGRALLQRRHVAMGTNLEASQCVSMTIGYPVA